MLMDVAVGLSAPSREVGEPGDALWLNQLVGAGATSMPFDLAWRSPRTGSGHTCDAYGDHDGFAGVRNTAEK